MCTLCNVCRILYYYLKSVGIYAKSTKFSTFFAVLLKNYHYKISVCFVLCAYTYTA